MSTHTQRGFTLMELLVVIAIIGILASVVLASLSTARNKGKAASVQASASQMRAQAELGVDNTGTYLPNLCTSAATNVGSLKTLIDATTASGGTGSLCGSNAATGVRPSAWGYQVTLPVGGYYCVDSTGYAGASTIADDITSGLSSGNVICNNSNVT